MNNVQIRVGTVTSYVTFMMTLSNSIESFFPSTMGEGAKKKRAADARAARMAKKKTAEVAEHTVEQPASESVDHDPPTSSDNKIPTQSTAKNPKKKLAAPRVPSTRPTRSQASSAPNRRLGSAASASSAKNSSSANLKNPDEKTIATRPKRVITATAKALLQEMQFSENDSEGNTDFEEDLDGGSNGESDVIELDDDDDGEDVGDAVIEFVEDGLALATRKGVPMPEVPAGSRGAQKKPKVPIQREVESSSGEFDDEFGEFFELLLVDSYAYIDRSVRNDIRDQ
jgi:hypothetical protein